MLYRKSFAFAILSVILLAEGLLAQDPPRYDEALKFYQAGRYEESLTVIRAVFDDYRGSVPLRLLAANNYLRLGNFESARAHMSFCIKENPNLPECHALLTAIYRTEQRPGPALKAARRGIQRSANSVPLRLEIAATYYSTGNYTAARTHLEKVLSLEPGNFHAIYMDGLIFLRKGEFTSAEFRLRNALDLKPKSERELINLYVNLGLALERSGDQLAARGQPGQASAKFREAARFYNYALRLDADNVVARTNRERINNKSL